MLRLGSALVLLLVSLLSTWPAQAQDGEVDTSFGTNGTAAIATPGSVSSSGGVLLPDGRYVGCGSANGDAVAVRFNADGSADTSFGTNGVFELDAAFTMSVQDCTQQADGKIVMAGATTETGIPLLVIRLTTNGTLDTSFSDDGYATITGPQSFTLARQVQVAPDGSIVVAGEYSSSVGPPFLARLTSSGALDTAFGTDGFVFETGAGRPTKDLHIDSSGRIWTAVEQGGSAEIYRYTSAGARDTSFDTDGLVTLPFSSSGGLTLSGFAFDSQGRIVVAGRINSGTLGMRRLTAAGQADGTFAAVSADINATAYGGESGGVEVGPVTVDARDQPIIVTGSASNRPAVMWRFTTSGTLDTRFGDFGTRTFQFGSATSSNQVGHIAVRPTGEIVASHTFFSSYQLAQLRARHPSRPDLSVKLLPAPAAVGPGASGTFRVVLQNMGWGASSSATVQVPVPTGFTYDAHTGAGTYQQETGAWMPGGLDDEQSTTLQLTLKRTSAAATTWIGEVQAQGETDYDSTPGNGLTTEDDYAALPISAFQYGGGQALALDGDGDYATAAAPQTIVPTLTIEAWVRFNSFPSGGSAIAAVNSIFASRPVLMVGGTGAADNQVRFGEGQGFFVDGPTLETGRWYHLAGTFDNRDKRLYVDGVLVGTNNVGNSSLALQTLDIGRDLDARYLNGEVDEVRVWTTARTQAEIQAGMYQGIDPPPASLLYSWTFNTPSGDARDLGASGTDAVLMGNATRTASTAPLSQSSLHLASTTPTALGAAGQRFIVTLSGSPSADNHLGLYRSGGDARITGETLPGTVVSRSGIVWGAREVGSVTAGLVFDFSGLTAINKATARLLKRNTPTAAWTDISSTCAYNSGASTFTCADVTDFSEFTIGEAETALPVELIAFEAVADDAQVRLRWTTASETNNAGFEVQHTAVVSQTNGWITLAFVDGQGTTLEAQQYAHTVANLAPGTHRFRLKQVDFDGTFAYSPEVEVTVSMPGVFALQPPFPHPATDHATLALTTATTQRVTVAVYDLLGRTVHAVADDIFESGATHRLAVDASALPSGVYLIRAEAGAAVQTQRFVVAR